MAKIAEESYKSRLVTKKKNKAAKWAVWIVSIIAALFVILLATRPSVSSTEAQTPLLGKQAPFIGGNSLYGSKISLPKMKGHFVVVNFFASWCIPCRQEQPQLKSFANWANTAPGQPLMVGVIFDDSVKATRTFLGSFSHQWPVVQDPNGTFALNYGVNGPPETFVINPNGKIIAKIVGPVTAKGLEAMTQSLGA